jgi:peptidoglycan/LPS O-acetylase OafA/YrhL
VEVGLFLAGILAYRLYARLRPRPIPQGCLFLAMAAFLAYLWAFPWLPNGFLRNILIYPLAFLAIPLVFRLTRKNPVDRIIGELSYPIYLCHHMIMQFVTFWYHGDHPIILAMCLTVLFCFLLHHFFQRPIEAYRQRRVYYQG